MSRGMGEWKGSNDGRTAKSRRQAIQSHVDARITSALSEPSKADLKAGLAEAVRNTAKIEVEAP